MAVTPGPERASGPGAHRGLGRSHRGVAFAAAAAVTAAGVVITVAATSTSSPADSAEDRAQPTETSSEQPSPTPGTVRVRVQEAVPAGSQINPKRPDVVVLPSGTAVPVRTASTLRNGTLAVPANIEAAGWWDGGARIGDPFGAILIAGHVDSAVQGLGPFAELLGVSNGDRVGLESRHLQQGFTIRSVELLPKSDFSDRPELFAADGSPRLVLVTCAGPFDAAAGGYQNLVIVTAMPSGRVADH